MKPSFLESRQGFLESRQGFLHVRRCQLENHVEIHRGPEMAVEHARDSADDEVSHLSLFGGSDRLEKDGLHGGSLASTGPGLSKTDEP